MDTDVRKEKGGKAVKSRRTKERRENENGKRIRGKKKICNSSDLLRSRWTLIASSARCKLKIHLALFDPPRETCRSSLFPLLFRFTSVSFSSLFAVSFSRFHPLSHIPLRRATTTSKNVLKRFSSGRGKQRVRGTERKREKVEMGWELVNTIGQKQRNRRKEADTLTGNGNLGSWVGSGKNGRRRTAGENKGENGSYENVIRGSVEARLIAASTLLLRHLLFRSYPPLFNPLSPFLPASTKLLLFYLSI